MKTKRKTPQKFVPYDYEEAYQDELKREDAALVEDLLKKGVRVIYATKRIDAGDQVEIEIYPEFVKREDLPPEARHRRNPAAQRTLKDKNARKHCERLINENFTSRDIWITLTYTDRNLPKSIEEALENMQRYIKRIAYRRKKAGLDPARYIYVTEWEEEGRKIRCHHHMIMDGDLDMDTVEKAWKLGRRNETRRLDYDENGLSGLAHYITKDPKGKKRWCASKNLRQPKEHKNHRTFGPKKVQTMIKNNNDAERLIQEAAPDCWFKSVEARYNPHNRMVYFYAKLRRKCAVGDLVTIAGGEDIGLDGRAVYDLLDHDGQLAHVRKHGKTGRVYPVELERLRLHRKGARAKRTPQNRVKPRNSRRLSSGRSTPPANIQG